MRRADKVAFLQSRGFTVGERDPRLNTAFKGAFMVVESHEESELPTEDGRNGPWCIVGDNLDELVDRAYDNWAEDLTMDKPWVIVVRLDDIGITVYGPYTFAEGKAALDRIEALHPDFVQCVLKQLEDI